MKLYRGELFYFEEVADDGRPQTVHFEDGALCVENDRIVESGDYAVIKAKFPLAEEKDYSGYLLMPGFIDGHIHMVQSEEIGLAAPCLLDWLADYTFPLESSFADPKRGEEIARLFLNELFRNGTTTCVAFGSVHASSIEALFHAALGYRMCLIGGKVQMDREAREDLYEDPAKGIAEAERLIHDWHHKGRLSYAITPRFAVSCTDDLLQRCGRLHETYPDTYIHTHLSENKGEIETVGRLFPSAKDYLQVYENYGLLTDRSLFAHGIHLSDDARQRLADSRATVVHCPTSNAFLGSGIYDMPQANRYGLQTIMGTDVGAGTSFSLFRTLNCAYHLQQLSGNMMTVEETFYKATLGSAKALHLDHEIGTLSSGHYADFIVVDYQSTTPQKLRRDYLSRIGQWGITQKLFGLQTMADDRAVHATYIAGRCVYGQSL